MRVLIAVVIALLGAVVLVLWFTHGAAPTPIAPTSTLGPDQSETALDKRDETLTPASTSSETPRIVTDTASRTTAPSASTGPQCRIHGRVVDENNAPLAGVSIRIYPVGSRWSDVATIALVGSIGQQHEELATKSSADGRYEFVAPVPTAQSIAMPFVRDAYHSYAIRRFGPPRGYVPTRIVEGDNDLGDMRLVRCGAAEGRVLSEAGDPLEKIVVATESNVVGLLSIPNVSTDAEGRYLLGHLTAEKQSLSFDGALWESREGVEADIAFGATTHVPDVILKSAGTMSGIVVDQSGVAIDGIHIEASAGDRTFSTWPATTAKDGSFNLRLTRPGKITLFVPEQKNYRSWGGGATETFDPGTTGIRIELAHAPTKVFRIVDAHNGGPIVRFAIRLDVKPNGGNVNVRTESELPLADHPGGELSMPYSGESSTVLATAPGHAAVELDVEPDLSKPQTIVLPLASSFVGRVMFAGEPVAHAVVTLQRDGVDPEHRIVFEPGAMGGNIRYDLSSYTGRIRALFSGTDGTFASGDLSPGTYALDFKASGTAHKWMRALVVAPEQALQLGDIVLDAGATVRGVLVAGADQSPIGFMVRMDGLDGHELSIDGIDGKFEFTGLEAGHHTITWVRPKQVAWVRSNQNSLTDDDPREQSLELAAGETRDVILDASASTPCQVVVHVLRGNAPARSVKIGARSHTPKKNTEIVNWLGTTDDNGTLEAEVDGDLPFDLIVIRGNYGELCELVHGIDAVPGGRIERTGTLSTGTLVVELPAALQPVSSAEINLRLFSSDGKARFATARTRDSTLPHPSDYVAVWDGNRIGFGEFTSGTYDATVTITRYDMDSAGKLATVRLHEPYTTKVTIEADHEAKIVLP